jgi:hypothetical protein
MRVLFSGTAFQAMNGCLLAAEVSPTYVKHLTAFRAAQLFAFQGLRWPLSCHPEGIFLRPATTVYLYS